MTTSLIYTANGGRTWGALNDLIKFLVTNTIKCRSDLVIERLFSHGLPSSRYSQLVSADVPRQKHDQNGHTLHHSSAALAACKQFAAATGIKPAQGPMVKHYQYSLRPQLGPSRVKPSHVLAQPLNLVLMQRTKGEI